ncbi:MAG: hypothetical protein WBW33_21825 [Bryobacteraceae bacterium]
MTKRNRSAKGRPKAFALALAALLTPASLAAFTMAIWRVAADLHWTGDFIISSGFLSHWQVWLIAASILLLCASILNRWGTGDNDEALS